MDKTFFTAGHSQKRTTSKRVGLPSQTSAGSRMEQNEWTVRTFPAYMLLPSEKLKVQWLVRITDKVLIMQAWSPKSPLWSTDRGCLKKNLDWWMAGFVWVTTAILGDKGIHQMLRGSRELPISMLESSVPNSPLPACSRTAATPQCDQDTYLISSHAWLSEAGFTGTPTGVLRFIDTFQLFFWLPYFSLDLCVSIICKVNIIL